MDGRGGRGPTRRGAALGLAALTLLPLLGALLALPEASAHRGPEPRAWETRLLEDANDDYPLTEGDIDLLALDVLEISAPGVGDHILFLRVGMRYDWNASRSQVLGVNVSFLADGEPRNATATTADGTRWRVDDLYEGALYGTSRGDQGLYLVQTFRRLGVDVGSELSRFRVAAFRVEDTNRTEGDRMPGFTVVGGNDAFEGRDMGWPEELPDLDRPVNESAERWDANNTTRLDPASGRGFDIGTYVLRGAVAFFDVAVNRTEAEVARDGFADFTVRVHNRLDLDYVVALRNRDPARDDWRMRHLLPPAQLLPANGSVEFRFRLSPLELGVPASRLRVPFDIVSSVGGQGEGQVFVRLVGVPRVDPRETHVEFLDLGRPPSANSFTLLSFRLMNETGEPLRSLTRVQVAVQRAGFFSETNHRLTEKAFAPGVYETVYLFPDPGTYRLRVTVFDFANRPSAEFYVDAAKQSLAEGVDLPAAGAPLGVLGVLVALAASAWARGRRGGASGEPRPPGAKRL